MNWICEGPIIKSLLDTDFYKFTMGQLVFRRYQDIKVVFGLINRSGAPLARFIREDDLRKELDYVRKLRFNNSELHYLRGTNEYGDRMFGEDFLQFLKIWNCRHTISGESERITGWNFPAPGQR